MISKSGNSLLQYIKKLRTILNQPEKKFLYFWFWTQSFLIVFDFIAIILAALVASAFVPIIQSHPENIPRIVNEFYKIIALDISIYKFLFMLAGTSGLLVLARSSISVLVENHFYLRLKFTTERLAKQLIENHFRLSVEKRAKISEVQTYIAIHESLNSLTIYVLGNLVSILAEVCTLTVFLIALLVWKPLVTSILLLTVSISTITSLRYHIKRSRKLSKSFTELNVESTQELFSLQKLESDYRLNNSFSEALEEYLSRRRRLSSAIAYRQVQFGIPRLILESSIVIGGLVTGVLIWYFMNVSQGLVVLATFMVIGLRVQPSLSKIQNGVQVFSQHRESSDVALNLLIHYSSFGSEPKSDLGEVVLGENLESTVKVVNLEYTFQDGNSLFNGLNFTFPKAGIYLLKGKNGVGKTTLLEILCGLRKPSLGQITLNGQNIAELDSEELSSAISYLSQKPSFTHQTILHSLILERRNQENESKIVEGIEILKALGLDLHKYNLEEELELDSLLSEGEKQKIGLARALSRKKKLILLDEPTSSLDHQAMVTLKNLLVEKYADCFIFIACHDKFFDEVSEGEIWI